MVQGQTHKSVVSPFPPTWASFRSAPLRSTAVWRLGPGDEVHLQKKKTLNQFDSFKKKNPILTAL